MECVEYAVVKCNQSFEVGIEGSIGMGCECEKWMIMGFVIAISFSCMMEGAVAARHLMKTPNGPPPPPPTCIIRPDLIICLSPPPPRSTTTAP
ncbi:hypothetical protein DEO72_LG8g2301 [Vigna unguiculata]|uniref:Uncharacterized protein n=1 Tax=Vigna unguiculata TaxID=3917 RepID=A0A4D6MS42_VIGUN|nr:hypothetical protein DEO72_LG8g2301 [Vigna unguiculata]